MSDNQNDEDPEFDPNPSPEAMADDLLTDSGVWAVGTCASQIDAAQQAGDTAKVQYWLQVTRHLVNGLISKPTVV